jgi:hypothetical protein
VPASDYPSPFAAVADHGGGVGISAGRRRAISSEMPNDSTRRRNRFLVPDRFPRNASIAVQRDEAYARRRISIRSTFARCRKESAGTRRSRAHEDPRGSARASSPVPIVRGLDLRGFREVAAFLALATARERADVKRKSLCRLPPVPLGRFHRGLPHRV